MIAVPIRVKTKFVRPDDVTVRAWREGMKAAHAAAGLHWHQEMLPRHFDPALQKRYPIRKRRMSTIFLKRGLARGTKRSRGHATPILGGEVDLVWSGRMSKQIMARATMRAYPSRVTVKMNGPQYLTMRPRTDKQPPMAAEILSVTPTERRELAKIIDEEAKRQFGRIPQTVTVVEA